MIAKCWGPRMIGARGRLAGLLLGFFVTNSAFELNGAGLVGVDAALNADEQVDQRGCLRADYDRLALADCAGESAACHQRSPKPKGVASSDIGVEVLTGITRERTMTAGRGNSSLLQALGLHRVVDLVLSVCKASARRCNAAASKP